MTSKQNTPYTYLIGWPTHNKYYYGVRYSTKAHPSDFWKTYFTSSKLVTEFRKQFGEPDIIQIRKTFKDADAAREWEYKVLKRLSVVLDNRFLNQTDSKAFLASGFNGKNHTNKHREKMSGEGNYMYGKTHTIEVKQKISEAKLGKKRKPFTEETRAIMSKNRIGRKRRYNNDGSWSWYYPNKI